MAHTATVVSNPGKTSPGKEEPKKKRKKKRNNPAMAAVKSVGVPLAGAATGAVTGAAADYGLAGTETFASPGRRAAVLFGVSLLEGVGGVLLKSPFLGGASAATAGVGMVNITRAIALMLTPTATPAKQDKGGGEVNAGGGGGGMRVLDLTNKSPSIAYRLQQPQPSQNVQRNVERPKSTNSVLKLNGASIEGLVADVGRRERMRGIVVPPRQ